MNKTVKILWLIIVFIGLIVIAVMGYNYLSEKYKPANPSDNTSEYNADSTEEKIITASDFMVLDQNGKGVNLKDNFGKPIVVNFWATWCGPCKSEMPVFNKLYDKYKDDVAFMMIDLTDGRRETIEKVNEFISTNNYNFPVYYDTDNNAAYTYGVNSVPMSLFINKNGEIIKTHLGAMSEDTLEGYLKELL